MLEGICQQFEVNETFKAFATLAIFFFAFWCELEFGMIRNCYLKEGSGTCELYSQNFYLFNVDEILGCFLTAEEFSERVGGRVLRRFKCLCKKKP